MSEDELGYFMAENERLRAENEALTAENERLKAVRAPLVEAVGACLQVSMDASYDQVTALKAGNREEAARLSAFMRGARACRERISAVLTSGVCEHEWTSATLFEKSCRKCGICGG